MRNVLNSFRIVQKDYWLMLITLFIMKSGQFILLPFLAIHLTNSIHIKPAVVGLIIGIGPIIYGITGVVAGMMVDRYGVKKIMVLSLFIAGIVISFYFYCHSILWLFLMSIFTGATRAFFDIGSKSYGISGLTIEQRKILFSLRFMTVNSAAAIGPLVGAYLTQIDSNLVFKMIGISYLLLAVISFFIYSNQNTINTNGNKPTSFVELFSIFKNDVALQILMLISLIIWMVYSQLDSTLAQYLSVALNNGIYIYSMMLVINAIGCLSLQLLVTHFTKRISDKILILIAMTLFAIAFIILAIFLRTSFLIFASLLIVLAEITIMPINDLLVVKIAPSERIGIYYGAVSLAMLGLGLGPMIGGYIFQYLGAAILFLLCSVSCIFTILLYSRINNHIVMR